MKLFFILDCINPVDAWINTVNSGHIKKGI